MVDSLTLEEDVIGVAGRRVDLCHIDEVPLGPRLVDLGPRQALHDALELLGQLIALRTKDPIAEDPVRRIIQCPLLIDVWIFLLALLQPLLLDLRRIEKTAREAMILESNVNAPAGAATNIDMKREGLEVQQAISGVAVIDAVRVVIAAQILSPNSGRLYSPVDTL